ncbi:MAG: GDP-mannose-dependent alpha-mannosyltransferase [Myxococcota bacterium]|nr:GDP-mannose-dependent alpha-mannosyltransferase [Myxococcota bacterium]
MRIFFFTDHFRPEPSAPAAHVYERARYWARWGHDVTVICATPNFPDGAVYPGYGNPWRFEENMDGVRVLRVKTYVTANKGFVKRTLDYMSYMGSAFVNALPERKPDVAISTSPHIFAAIGGLSYALARRVPHVLEVRDLWPGSLPATIGLAGRLLYRPVEQVELNVYRQSTLIMPLTHAFKEDMVARGVPASKVEVVINGANLELFTPRERDAELSSRLGLDGKFVVSYLGTLGLASGLLNAVEAAELLRDTPFRLLLVGSGAIYDQLAERIRSAAAGNVILLGRQLKEEIPRYWSVTDLSLIHLENNPVFKTVIPSKIFESMAMGKPILYAVPEGEGSSIVRRHDAGEIVPPGDPRALADAIRQLMNNPRRLRGMADNSLRAAPGYSREKQARRTLEVLERAVREYSG